MELLNTSSWVVSASLLFQTESPMRLI